MESLLNEVETIIYSFTFCLNRLLSWYFWKFFMPHKFNRFWRICHDVIISWNDVIVNKVTRYFSCLVNISLWLKFDDNTSYKTKVIQIHTLKGFNQKNVIFQEIVLSLGLWLRSRASCEPQNFLQDVK